MGHDFPKDKDVGGNLSNLEPKGGKTHVFSSLSYSNHFLYERLLVVEAVNDFGSGVAGLSVLTHTHTLPMILAVHLLTQTFIFTPRVAEHPRIAESCPSY